MDLGWHIDNPAIALEKYSVDSVTFEKKKLANEVLESELSTKQSELSSKKIELNALKDKLSAMGEYVTGDTDALVQSVIDDAKKKEDKETRKFELQKEGLLGQKGRALKENDEWLRARLAQLLGENEDVVRDRLAAHPELVPQDFTLPSGIASQDGMLTLWPGQHETDGFFISKFTKRTF